MKRRSTWTTYCTRGYTHDVANDQASAGGVHHYQVRRTPTGWQRRIKQSNGSHTAYSPIDRLSDEEGEQRFAAAD